MQPTPSTHFYEVSVLINPLPLLVSLPMGTLIATFKAVSVFTWCSSLASGCWCRTIENLIAFGTYQQIAIQLGYLREKTNGTVSSVPYENGATRQQRE